MIFDLISDRWCHQQHSRCIILSGPGSLIDLCFGDELRERKQILPRCPKSESYIHTVGLAVANFDSDQLHGFCCSSEWSRCLASGLTTCSDLPLHFDLPQV